MAQQIFYKYQGTGNDFIMIDNRKKNFNKNNASYIKRLCDRRFGIGADGLILLEDHENYDFRMVYYNADGNESSMCGNGGRCLVAFAKQCGIVKNNAIFEAIDGIHHAIIEGDLIKLKMIDVNEVEVHKNHVFLNTGSPHHVQFEDHIDTFDIKSKGASIRYGELYGDTGANVNFVKKITENTFKIRTYERGVEDETLSCGTGATAVALAMHHMDQTQANKVTLQVEGGDLQVSFHQNKNGEYTDIWLIGPACFVYEGHI